jgi:BirA family biotin operon repressor/biotin-[acetyl-CoA-carboxylase] ligase
MITIHLPEVDSTNNYLLRQLEAGVDYPDGTVVYTSVQSCGRGQQGNSWESEPGMNLAFTLLLKPTFLPPAMSFALSELTALALVEALDELTPGFQIKWPNDVYHDDRKAVGILIENRLSGRTLSLSLVGVGVNLNQRTFRSSAPNPVSVAQLLDEAAARTGSAPTSQGCAAPISIERTLNAILQRLMGYYTSLQVAARTGNLQHSEAYTALHTRYMACLYRGRGLHPYQDAETGEQFRASIEDVEPTGALHLRTADGALRRYMFKEVKFCLPCGVVKE